MRSRTGFGFGLLLLLATPGCVIHSIPLQQPVRAAQPIPDEVAQRFAYEVVTPATLQPGYTDRAAEVQPGMLAIQLEGDEGPTPVGFEFWRSLRARGPAPVIILTPILGGGKGLTRDQCRFLTEAGFHVIYAKRGVRVLRADWKIPEIERWLRRAIAARRALIDWAQARPDVDPDHVGAFGISMGGIVTSVLTAVEPRIQSAVIALAGSDVPGVITVSSEERLIRYRETKSKELHIDLQQVEDQIRANLPSDPGDLARFIDPRRVLQVTSRWDTVVPPEHQLALWERMGRPLRYDLPAAHYSGILYLPYLMGMATDWLHERFQDQGAPVQ